MMFFKVKNKQLDRTSLLLLAVLLATFVATLEVEAQETQKPPERHKYWIDLKIDVDNLSYTGSERVRWINRGEKPSSVLYFHLYPNIRVTEPEGGINANT